MPSNKKQNYKISFLAFFLMYAERRKWTVPDIHVTAAHWLQNKGDLGLLRCFRGFGKSTLLEIYNAWRYYENAEFRILHQSESDGTANKTSRGTKNVLMTHPLTKGLFKEGGVEQWWVHGSTDVRNASMYAKGILSNVTSARADEAQNDDVEVPRNIQNPEAREKLRFRLGEQTHILVPGGSQLFIGTPHTHDSIYDELEEAGADCLTIKMFAKEQRIEDCSASGRKFKLLFTPEFVFNGIGRKTKSLVKERDYFIIGNVIQIASHIEGLVDLYSQSAWPERFDIAEMTKRRKKCRTVNEWDSQYQLHSKPINQVRLDPEHIIPYDVEPQVRIINGTLTLWLGKVQIVSVSARLDPSSAKPNSDVCSFSVMFSDDAGRLYWHVAKALEGELAEFDNAGKVIGGQVWQLCDVIEKYQIPRVTIETNGIGGHVPAILRGALKARKLTCAVVDKHTSKNKNALILQAYEPPISSRYLWAHVTVLETVWDEMRDWNPAVKDQQDDHLNSGAMAIMDEPIRIGKAVSTIQHPTRQDWRPNSGVYEVQYLD